jgi:hypothetical protein
LSVCVRRFLASQRQSWMVLQHDCHKRACCAALLNSPASLTHPCVCSFAAHHTGQMLQTKYEAFAEHEDRRVRERYHGGDGKRTKTKKKHNFKNKSGKK